MTRRPSLHSHYKSFITTTRRSANRNRNGTHTHATRGLLPVSRTETSEREVSVPAFSRSMQKPQTGLASPPCRTPPGQSTGTRQTHPGILPIPRFRCHLRVSTRQQRIACARLPDPHLAHHVGRFHIAHHDHVTDHAACGGLKPPPAGRLRRASNPSSPAQHRIRKALPTFELPSTLGTHRKSRSMFARFL